MSDTNRRRFLALLGAGTVGVAAAAVGRRLLEEAEPMTHASPPASTRPTTPPSPTPIAASPTTTSPPPSEPPRPVAYETVPGEVFADAKLVASRVVEALTTYSAHEDAAAAVERAWVFATDDADRSVAARRAGPLLVAGAESEGRIRYPQLGGLHPHAAPATCSVMVVVDQQLRRPDRSSQASRCVDVRLRHAHGEWRLEGLADTSREAVPRPAEVSPAVARALDHPHIELPDSARWDVHAGAVDERVLVELADIADHHPVAVTCFRRGHPEHVFGTSRLSAHSVGRAVDVWRVGDAPVVQQQPEATSLAHLVAREIYDRGRVTNLGSPWELGGPGTRSFTDPVHHDHLHLGVPA